MPYYLSHYYHLNLDNLPTSLLPLPLLESLFFLISLLLLTCSPLISLFLLLNIAQFESLPLFPILSFYHLWSFLFSHTSKNSTPTFFSLIFTISLIWCLLSSIYIITFTDNFYIIIMANPSMLAYSNKTIFTFNSY